VLKPWLAAAPPPNPDLRLTPDDRKVTVEWDNLSEITPDPSSGFLDFNTYRIWKASNYTRPVGSSGPAEELWALLAELKIYDYLTPLKDSLDTNQDGLFDSTMTTYPVLLNAAAALPIDVSACGSATLLQGVPASARRGDTAYRGPPQVSRWRGAGDGPTTNRRSIRVGRKVQDPNVLNGFIYYSVTSVVDRLA
jgi:hypothetical protein